ncbi:MAG: endolytic transglycosylase MltG [Actinomycetota bacterium]|nr:endolytic transglycosylase MltG [Actinomycetota bacterium]
MGRRSKRRRQEFEELDARLEALKGGRYRKRKSRAGATVFGFLLIGCVMAVVYLIYVAAISGIGGGGDPVTVTVAEGDTLSVVADKLQEAGVIRSATAFKIETRVEGTDTALKPGKYELRTGMESEAVIDKLIAGQPVPTFTLTIPEGLTIEQTAEAVAEQSDISAEKFEAAARETDYGFAFLENPEIETTEGFLFPKKYEFGEEATATQVVNRMLEQYFIETQNLDFTDPVGGLNLTEYEIVTVASLIEREAANVEERPLVAAVIYNRLRDDMPLQIDATIQYARGEPKAALSYEDLEIDSPYNTYQNTGLPPGPIASPSLQSLKAAVSPAEVDYSYYVLKKDGEEHFFTDDYDEFLKAKEEAGR